MSDRLPPIEPVFNSEDVKLFAEMTTAITQAYYHAYGMPASGSEMSAVVFLAQVQAWQACLLRQAQEQARALRERMGEKLQ
jgi:hypothetical protein